MTTEGAVVPQKTGSAITAWWATGVLLVLCVVSFLDRQLISLLIAPIRADFGVSDFHMGMLQGLAFAAFFAVCGLPLGWAVDRFSRRAVVFFGVTTWSIAASAGGFASQFWHLLLARFGVGAGEAALSPAAYSLLSALFPPHRLALALSIYGAGAVIGSAGAVALGGMLIQASPAAGITVPGLGHFSAWQFVLLLSGLPGLLLGWLAFTIKEPERPARLATTDASGVHRILLRNRRFYVGHVLGFSFNSLASYGLVLWTPAYLARSFGMEAGEIGLAMAAAHIPTGLVGALSIGYVVDRWFARGQLDAHLRFFACSVLVQAVLVGIAVSMPSAALFLVFAGLAHCFAAFTGVAAAALQIVTPAGYRGRVSSVFLFILYMIGLGCGPAIVGAFTDFLFADDLAVGWSIALTYAIFAPLSALMLGVACRSMREAVKLAQ